MAEMLNAELFECESEELIVDPGQEFFKEWNFTNTGAYQWPAGVQLKQTQGDQFITENEVLEEPVLQDGACSIT